MRTAISKKRRAVPIEVDPRILRTQNVVRAAALELLAELGFGEISIESISERSGVARSTIYRHWPDLKDLLIEAFESVLNPTVLPETGELRADLIMYCMGLANVLNDPLRGAIVGSLIDASLRDPKVAAAHSAYTQKRRLGMRRVLQDAESRGALPKGLDFDHIITSLVAPVFYCRFIIEQLVDRAFVERVVDGVLVQIRSDSAALKSQRR